MALTKWLLEIVGKVVGIKNYEADAKDRLYAKYLSEFHVVSGRRIHPYGKTFLDWLKDYGDSREE